MMSKAVRIDRHGGPEELKIVDVEVGEPGPGEIRIRHKAVGLTFIDTYQRTGLYPFQMPLQTSTPINVTLVGSSLPLWMLAVGTLCFGARVSRRALGGAMLSMLGVLLVLSRGEWQQLLALRLVPGDLYMIAGTIAWAFYSLSLIHI